MDTTKPNWWRKLTDCDPISLEPLRRLRVPPFNLVTDEQQRACWFDGKLLANYLISSGSFLHPISRRSLTGDDCSQLDAHLVDHRLGKPGVKHAFDHVEDYKKQQSPENQVLRMQAEANAVLRSLYESMSGGQPSDDSGEGGRAGRGRGRGRHAPEPEWQVDPSEVEPRDFQESVPLGGADLGSAAEFPSLLAAAAAAAAGAGAEPPEAGAPAVAPLNPSWLGSSRGVGVVTLGNASQAALASMSEQEQEEAFPSLGGNGAAGRGRGRGRGAPTPGWGARSSAAPAPGYGAASGGGHVPAPPPFAAARAMPTPDQLAEAFPSLGGEFGAARRAAMPAAAPLWKAHSAAHSAVAVTPLSSGGGASAPQPPKEFAATNAEFPSLGGPPAALPPARKQKQKQKQKGGGGGGGGGEGGDGPAAVLVPPRSREEAVLRNKLLMQSLAEAVLDSGRPDGLLEFKALSVGYQRGQIDAAAYVEAFVSLLGSHVASRLFPEVAQLLPDPDKRVELSAAYDESFHLHARPPQQPSQQPAGAGVIISGAVSPGLGGGEAPAGRGRGRGRGRGQLVR